MQRDVFALGTKFQRQNPISLLRLCREHTIKQNRTAGFRLNGALCFQARGKHTFVEEKLTLGSHAEKNREEELLIQCGASPDGSFKAMAVKIIVSLFFFLAPIEVEKVNHKKAAASPLKNKHILLLRKCDFLVSLLAKHSCTCSDGLD